MSTLSLTPYAPQTTFSGYSIDSVTRQIGAGGLSARYMAAGATSAPDTASIAAPALKLDLQPYLKGAIVPGSLLFRLGSYTYCDRAGVLYHSVDPLTGAGTAAGTINYASGVVSVTAWPAGAWSFTLLAGLINPGTPGMSGVMGRTSAWPLKSQSFSITATALDGSTISATVASDSTLSAAQLTGLLDLETGLYAIQFGAMVGGEWVSKLVDPSTIRYNAVAYTYLPLDSDVLGIDPVRLPSDGRVPIFRGGDVVQIMHTAETTGTPALEGTDYVLPLGRTRIGWARVRDAAGAAITSGYTLDRELGRISFASLSGVATPITVRHTVSDLRRLSDVQITGALTITGSPLTHEFPAGESIVSGCLIHGDRRARVSAVWDQATWSGAWSDVLVGSNATATLNTITHPITVTNEGAETERWILRWLTTTTVELIGEHVGLVYSGSYTAGGADIAPINPRTRGSDGQGGVPYMVIPAAANGGGWAAGNVVRINTVGAIADIWLARAIQPSDVPAGDGTDGCEIYCLGNIDRT